MEKSLDRILQKDWRLDRLSSFPCIIIAYEDIFDSHIAIGDGKLELSRISINDGHYSVLPVSNGIGGLFVSSQDTKGYRFPSIATSICGAALIEATENGFKVLRFRRLQKDKAMKAGTGNKVDVGGR